MRAENATARELQKASDSATKLANQVSEKIAPVLHLIRSTMSHPRFNELPVVARDATTAALNTLVTIEADCETINSGDHNHVITGIDSAKDRLASPTRARQASGRSR